MAVAIDVHPIEPITHTASTSEIFKNWQVENEKRKKIWHQECISEIRKILQDHKIPVKKDTDVERVIDRIKRGYTFKIQGDKGSSDEDDETEDRDNKDYVDKVTALIKQIMLRDEEYRERLLLLSVPRERPEDLALGIKGTVTAIRFHDPIL